MTQPKRQMHLNLFLTGTGHHEVSWRHPDAQPERIGLIGTVSTTYNEPFRVVRKFASLDHLSGGRVGWNIVTSGNEQEAQNFGREEHLAHSARYGRAGEFL